MASLTVPITADKNYKDAFNLFARQRGRTMAALVREALDEKFGKDMQPYLSFFEQDGVSKQHLETEGVSNG
jgi:hypothetical protein